MERLKDSNPCNTCKKDRQIGNPDSWQSPCSGCNAKIKWRIRAIEKALLYEDLEKQGLLIKLPCAVGTTLYAVSFKIKCKYEEIGYLIDEDINCAFCDKQCNSKKEWFIHEIKANLPTIANLILHKDNPSDDFRIYLTREQAEQSLKEMESENE